MCDSYHRNLKGENMPDYYKPQINMIVSNTAFNLRSKVNTWLDEVADVYEIIRISPANGGKDPYGVLIEYIPKDHD